METTVCTVTAAVALTVLERKAKEHRAFSMYCAKGGEDYALITKMYADLADMVDSEVKSLRAGDMSELHVLPAMDLTHKERASALSEEVIQWPPDES